MNNYMKTIISGLKQWVSSQKPDWKQNDSSAANYVKNRTHYEEDKLTQIFKSEIFAYPDFIDLEDMNVHLPLDLSLDILYKVVFDGKIYECIPYDAYGYGVQANIGCSSLLTDIENVSDNNEPFVISWNDNGDYSNITVAFKDNATIHTISLYSIVDGVETAIFENIECDVSDYLAFSQDSYGDKLKITEEGKKYTVILDGKTFECVSKYDTEYESYYLGGHPSKSNAKETFYIETNSYINGSGETQFDTYIATTIASNHEITVLENTPFVHKLDKKYLPDDLVRTEDIADVAISGSYKDLVDSDVIDEAIGAIGAIDETVRYSNQSLTETQKLQARTNIGADSYENIHYKPCGIETTRTLFAKFSASFDSTHDNNIKYEYLRIIGSNKPIIGKKYEVSIRHPYYNNEVYSFRAAAKVPEGEGYESFISIGNLNLWQSKYENTGEPFCLIFTPPATDNKIGFANIDILGTGLKQFYINEITEGAIMPLDERLIPNTIAKASDVVHTADFDPTTVFVFDCGTSADLIE